MYNQFQNNFGSSQYQGYQRPYQPVGQVQSFYGQNQQQQYGGYPSSEAYHTSNYRGNQQGHDASLRSDSWSSGQQQGGYPSSESYHTSSYRGNQLGHDVGLRGDSMSSGQQGAASGADYSSFRYGVRGHDYSGTNNVQSQFGFNQGFSQGISQSMPQMSQSFNQGQSRFSGMYSSSQAGIGNQSNYAGQSSFGGQASWGQNPSTEAYHNSNYRGNQLGHDQGLRGDSFSAQQQGFGTQSFQPSTNYSSFQHGVRGHDISSQNNVSQQFGFNNAY